ncbi:lasso peptide biosynthesis B2 protein [Streptomyces sp. BBFR102]|uniref:lasso peptide biosynthesis B2 protein n=1 Tax=Streptomyces sp. BBFR102 TaxID=3448171 RepID=UPI003F52978C
MWASPLTDRIWAAAVEGRVVTLIATLAAEGHGETAEHTVQTTIDQLVHAGYLTTAGPGLQALPEQMPDVAAPAPDTDRPPSRPVRWLARTGLALSLILMTAPLRWRLRALAPLRVLPAAPPALAGAVSAAIPQIRPAWYRGRIACMEISLATVLALALCGRRAHWVLGARQLPTEAHAWVWTGDGALGLSGCDRPDPRRPWVGALAAPPVRLPERANRKASC